MACRINDMKNTLKHSTPQHVIQLTIGREYTKPKLKAPHFDDATKPMPAWGKLGEILKG